jgi:superkiller protein 3
MLALAEQWKLEDERNPAAYTFAAIALSQLKFVDKATVEVEKAMAVSPNYLGAKLINIGIKERQGRGTEAEILATKALAVESRDNADEASRVSLLMRLKRSDEAWVLAQRLLTEEPKAAYAQAAFCRAGMGGGDRARATEVCKQYVESWPDNIYAWLNLSSAYLGQGRFDDSLAAARKAIEINPEIAEGWLAVGVVAEAKGERQRVSEAEQRIRELDPTILERFNKQRSAQGCYRDRRDKLYASAVESCKEAARLDDRNAGVLSALGDALLWEKHLDEGIAAHENAVRLNPNLELSWSDLTYSYARKKDAAKTRAALEHLRSLNSKAADGVYAKVRDVLN